MNVLARLAPEHDNDDEEGHKPPPPQQQQHEHEQGQKQKQAAGEGKKKGRFLLFEQRKYGFEGLRCVRACVCAFFLSKFNPHG